ncbi:helix-turn-helix domain-containing protein [Burkholderia ubonensis]|uniref:helix-turn-helix domain-containing protein n=1 Tax=Burkholderia ubonensis TaxID=101571 RepID=UPI001E5ED68C|nr:helix-turn-helix domain-containing protein [Burkholderia ubonensis]
MRLEYGRWQLTNNRISLTQITLDCGFSDGVHFPRDFRDRFGVSPRSLQQLAQSRTQTETSVSTVRCEVDGRPSTNNGLFLFRLALNPRPYTKLI